MKPNAPPDLATMEICSGLVDPGSNVPTACETIACPTSCAETLNFSLGPNSERFFSTPATVLKTAFSNSSLPTVVLFSRPASNAASFTRFSKSAPVKPLVIVAISSNKCFFPSCALFSNGNPLVWTWTSKISRLPWTSGLSTWTIRSNRPGRRNAASNVSGRFVAPMHITNRLASASNPSNSVSS